MKKIIPLFLAAVMMLQYTAYGLTDDRITTDPVANIYYGRGNAELMQKNLAFADVSAGHWARERITRSGALDMVKGDAGGRYRPDSPVSNQEALAFVLRVMGLENEAHQLAAALQAGTFADSPLRTLWSLGYLNLAVQNGLITPAQYNNATAADQTTLTAPSFMREGPAARQDVAHWIYLALMAMEADAFDPAASRQKIFTFSDYGDIAANRVEAVEAITAAGIMQGANGRFNPRSALTRAEMAALLANMDAVYLPIAGLEKKTGTVGGVLDGQYTTTGSASLGRRFYVRNADGAIDILLYGIESNASPQSGTTDAVVYKDGVGGLLTLSEGDQIEYIVSPMTEEVYYVQVTNPQLSVKTVQGQLQAVDTAMRTVTITDASGKSYTYPLAEGMISGNTVFLSNQFRDVAGLPLGSRVSLRLKNNVADEMTYVGEPTVYAETRGIVTENNTEFGYLSFIDNSGNEVTRNYISGELMVEKLPYYMTEDTVGYLSRVFPSFVYNPRAAAVEDIEPGDIIFLTTDAEGLITSISASTNYMMRYGQIKSFAVDGDTAGMLVEYENKQTAWFDIASDIPITKAGRLQNAAGIMPGDWARLLINQAIIEPGVVMESVKEITVEGGDGHFISNIVKGQLAGINTVQNQIMIQNSQTLAKSGWTDYQNLSQFSIAGRDIEYYMNDARVTLDYINNYLKRSDGEVYIALINDFTGEKVRRVTFRDGRDELLSADTVVNTDGSGGFMLSGSDGAISTDAGTIVRRYGRLVEGWNILPPDYAVVSLNGGNRAAIVDIADTPGTEGITVVRGRVLSVNEGKSFKVQSMAMLTGNSWTFSPVQREFTIDNQTLFLNEAGLTSIDDFIGYGEASVVDRVYTIVIDGGRAARVYDAPYATNTVRGLVYETSNTDIKLRDVEYLDNDTGRWSPISRNNPLLSATFATTTIIAKDNKLIGPDGLVKGDYVRVMTAVRETPPAPGETLNSLIVRVDK